MSTNRTVAGMSRSTEICLDCCPGHYGPDATGSTRSTNHIPCIVLLVALLIAACSRGADPASIRSDTPEISTQTPITLDDLPEGLGRGYPTASIGGVDNQNTGVSTGDIAPNFQLVWEDGRTATLHDFQGQPVMLNFWATWCGPCRLEMPDIVKQSEEHKNLVVLAINVQEDLKPVQAFAGDFQMSMPIVLDPEGHIRELYQLRGMPTSVFIDADGKISVTWAGLLTPDKLSEFLDAIL